MEFGYLIYWGSESKQDQIFCAGHETMEHMPWFKLDNDRNTPKQSSKYKG